MIPSACDWAGVSLRGENGKVSCSSRWWCIHGTLRRTECIVTDVAVTKDRGAVHKDFRIREEATTSRRAFEANSAGCGFDKIG